MFFTQRDQEIIKLDMEHGASLFLRNVDYREAMSLEGWGSFVAWEPKPDVTFGPTEIQGA